MKLDTPGEDGASLRENLTYLRETHGIHDERLYAEPVLSPLENQYLAWFWEINGGRQSSGFGAQPISWMDIWCWSRLTRTPLAPWEVSLMRTLDVAYRSALNDA